MPGENKVHSDMEAPPGTSPPRAAQDRRLRIPRTGGPVAGWRSLNRRAPARGLCSRIVRGLKPGRNARGEQKR